MKSFMAPMVLVCFLLIGVSFPLQAADSAPEVAASTTPDVGSGAAEAPAPSTAPTPLELLLNPPATPAGPCTISLVCNCSGVTISCSTSSGTCQGGDEGTCGGFVQCSGQPVIECPLPPPQNQCSKDFQCTEICGGFGLCRNNRCIC